MNKYDSFNGTKFRPTGEVTSHLDSVTNERVYKDDFMPTKAYSTYLKLKQLKDLEFECKVLKHKLDRQQQEYNEVDPIDLGEYNYKLREYYKLLAIVTK